MSKSVNVDFVTRQIEVDTDGKEHFISAAMAAKDAEQSMLSAQNAANAAEAVAPEYAKTKAVLDNIVSYTNTATEQANIATEQVNIATAKATIADNSATNAAQSYANADAIAGQLTEYLNTKEELTAPAVDKTLLIEGAAADSKVVGEIQNNILNRFALLVGNNLIFQNKLYKENHYYKDSDEFSIDYSYMIIPVKAGVTYKVFGCRFISSNNILKRSYNLIDGEIAYTADETGDLYVTFFNSADSWYFCDSENYIGTMNRMCVEETLGTNTSPLSQKYITKLISNMFCKDNLILTKNMNYNKLWNGKESIDSDVYSYLEFDALANIEYTISPKVRQLYLNNVEKLNYQHGTSEPITFIPDSSGKVRINFYNSSNELYVCESNKLKSNDGFINSYLLGQQLGDNDKIPISQKAVTELFNKIDVNKFLRINILNIGDSIAENRADSESYAYQFAKFTGATLQTDYAEGGSTMSYIDGQGMGSVLKQAQRAIEENPLADYKLVLIDGMANDFSARRDVGNIVKTSASFEIADYDASFDTTSYIGALEETIRLLRSAYKNSIIIFVIPHKHDRTGELWEQYIVGASDVCDKWSVGVLNMDKDGELNTRILAMRTEYTDEGGTHPNTLGIKKFYLPRLVKLVDAYFLNSDSVY